MKYLVAYSYSAESVVVGFGDAFVKFDMPLTEPVIQSMREEVRKSIGADRISIMNMIPLTGEK